ncbi:ca2+-modulated nonselective cation channel polycystin protein [Penicillium digitatum]|uniref:Ca2+-modulated nonselective cation channel polycystin n=3 Tax=Penicillium digitatum TaxID=36651 RepID=K9GEC0_PEND2|nr:hypothetical protein PDIP_13700 [Penicillium digitatum Pd1]EKV19547.1 hypothetical protein PDIG_02410 [Penicillium digitatum PHI26]EKV20723.1 hypothetical protein PDIP_13700 [Penicillium digitatum Pd1]QQK44875.1 ca2+-modulated nonselective cation channel polycystin protein [Penicillium digitatum]
MATADGPARVHDRNVRRRPFSNWVKRLANLKSSSDSATNRWSNKRYTGTKGKKSDQENNPYPLSGTIKRDTGTRTPTDSYIDDQCGADHRSKSDPSLCSGYENPAPLTSAKSAAPTISTNGDAALSEAAYSKAGTLATGTEGFSTHGGGEGSTFSSPAPSIRSMTTTLTTVHSAAPSTQLYNAQNNHNGHHHHHGSSMQSSSNQQIQFSHQFPSTSPATAVPSHLVPQSHAMTYSAATANNALTDNASLLTLASSSKRRRRNSLDTNASVRGLAPSSVFGGSRESLPLSVLSGNATEVSNTSVFSASGVLSRPSIVGLASAERISVYSASGVIPLASTAAERGSLYTTKPTAGGDTTSIRSSVHSHSRNDSTAPSIAGGIGSQLALAGRMSRRSSGWGEITGEEGNNGKQVEKNEDEMATKDQNACPIEPLKN